jgi:hypothetical protein
VVVEVGVPREDPTATSESCEQVQVHHQFVGRLNYRSCDQPIISLHRALFAGPLGFWPNYHVHQVWAILNTVNAANRG